MPRPRTTAPAPRRGFTLIEMMISITILMIIFAMAVPFFRAEARSVDANAQRLDARTGGRYGAASIDRDLRVAGVNTPAAQPVIVQAQANAITVNGDFVSRDTGDVFAVYINKDADPTSTGSLTSSNAITLPNSSSWRYPSTTYRNDDSGTPSEAETVSYWVAPDSERPGYQAIFRRVNGQDPRVVVRNVVVPSGKPVFRYFYVASDGKLTEVTSDKLPMRHSVANHGDPADTGAAGFIDTIRVVRVRIQTVARDERSGRTDTLTQESSIRVMNAGLLKRTSCGADPGAPAFSPAALPTASVVGTQPQVNFVVLPSVDESGGEKDVMRYVIYRRLDTETDWGEPVGSIVASGAAAYPYQDLSVQSGASYYYGVAAVDCTPRSSAVAVAPSKVTVP